MIYRGEKRVVKICSNSFPAITASSRSYSACGNISGLNASVDDEGLHAQDDFTSVLVSSRGSSSSSSAVLQSNDGTLNPLANEKHGAEIRESIASVLNQLV